MLGWDAGSWGYHVDDGKKFECGLSGAKYGDTFDIGDVIGCGVNFSKGIACYTKNGTIIGKISTNNPQKRYMSFNDAEIMARSCVQGYKREAVSLGLF